MPEEIEEPQESQETQGGGGATNLLSPEGFVMMSVAVILDLIGIILICFALDDFGITDLIGMVFIGSWMLFRSGALPEKRSPIKKSGGVERNILKKLGFTSLLEIIPYLGAFFWWTIMVYQELTS